MAAFAIGLIATPTSAQQGDVASSIAVENANLAVQLRTDAAALDRASASLRDANKAKDDLEERMQRIERRAGVYALGQEFAQTLTDYLHSLPRPERFDAGGEERARELAEASDAHLRAERTLRELSDIDDATAQRMSAAALSLSQQDQAQAKRDVRAALADQRELLGQVAAIERK